MLKWEKDINGYNGHWMGGYIGFDDGCPLIKSVRTITVDTMNADGMDGYETAEEAMAAAEFEVAAKEIEIDWEDLEPLTWEDLEDIHWDEVAHERMEIMKGLY